MHKLRKLAAGIAAAAAVAVVATAVPALADPPVGSHNKAVVPASYDVVGVGANTDDNLFNQLTADYNKTIPASKHNAGAPLHLQLQRPQAGHHLDGCPPRSRRRRAVRPSPGRTARPPA